MTTTIDYAGAADALKRELARIAGVANAAAALEAMGGMVGQHDAMQGRLAELTEHIAQAQLDAEIAVADVVKSRQDADDTRQTAATEAKAKLDDAKVRAQEIIDSAYEQAHLISAQAQEALATSTADIEARLSIKREELAGLLEQAAQANEAAKRASAQAEAAQAKLDSIRAAAQSIAA